MFISKTTGQCASTLPVLKFPLCYRLSHADVVSVLGIVFGRWSKILCDILINNFMLSPQQLKINTVSSNSFPAEKYQPGVVPFT